jgi:alanyl-tRNA synthetase
VFASKDNKVGIAVGVTDSLTEKFDAVQFVKVGIRNYWRSRWGW